MSTAPSTALINAFVVPNGGALLLAAIVSTLFYGITILQTYLYYDRYLEDAMYLRIFVAVLMALDTAQQGLVTYSAWWYLVPNYGNLESTKLIPPGVGYECAITVSTALLAQCFFAHRVWSLSGQRKSIPLAIVALSLTQFALAMYYVAFIQTHNSIGTLAEVSWSAAGGIACAMTADFLITIFLCYYLHVLRSGMPKSDKLVNLLVLYTVNTGLLTSLNSICCIVLTTVSSTTFWFSIPFCLVSKCYVNSVLATLTARERLRSINSGTALRASLNRPPWLVTAVSAKPDIRSTQRIQETGRSERWHPRAGSLKLLVER